MAGWGLWNLTGGRCLGVVGCEGPAGMLLFSPIGALVGGSVGAVVGGIVSIAFFNDVDERAAAVAPPLLSPYADEPE